MNLQSLLVGRPGLDPGALRVASKSPGTSLRVQICWPDEIENPLSSSEIQARLLSWLDSWLDLDEFQGTVAIEIQQSGA